MFDPDPLAPENVESIEDRLLFEVQQHVRARMLLNRHSMFAYPHFWLWHAVFDGTWLCRCWHSREIRSGH
jgi:hypothetical protein